MKENIGSKLARFVVRFRWAVIFLVIAAFMGAASGGRFLEFSSNSRTFFGKENPQLKALETLENTYSKDDNILLAITPENKNVFTRETLAIVEEITEKFWQLPAVWILLPITSTHGLMETILLWKIWLKILQALLTVNWMK